MKNNCLKSHFSKNKEITAISSSINVNDSRNWQIVEGRYSSVWVSYNTRSMFGRIVEEWYECSGYNQVYKNIYTNETKSELVIKAKFRVILMPTGKIEWAKISETDNYIVEKLYIQFIVKELNYEGWYTFNAPTRVVAKEKVDTKI